MPVEVIDGINILQAALKAMVEAVDALPTGYPDYVLVDGNRLPKVAREQEGGWMDGAGSSACIGPPSIARGAIHHMSRACSRPVVSPLPCAGHGQGKERCHHQG